MRKPAFVKGYTEAQRKEEVEVVRQLVPHAQQCKKKLWFLTVVTKEDLWCKEPGVDGYYRDGPFGMVVKGLLSHHGHRHFRTDLALTSLVISNLAAAPDEVWAENKAGYDQARQVQSLRRLIEVLNSLREWGEA